MLRTKAVEPRLPQIIRAAFAHFRHRDPELLLEPLGHQPPVAEGARPLPAEEDGVVAEVGIDRGGVELRQDLLPVAPGVLVLVDGAALGLLYEAPGGGQRLKDAAGPAAGLAPGYGNGFGVGTGSGEV